MKFFLYSIFIPVTEIVPAKPPDTVFLASFFAFVSFAGLGKRDLIWSLNAKFIACIGMYLITEAVLPLQKDINPSFL